MAIIIDGKKTSIELENELRERVIKLKDNFRLSIFIAGNNYASEVYVKMKKKACEKIGLGCEIFQLEEKIKTEKLISLIEKENKNKNVCGIMVQHPLPKHISEDDVFNSIAVGKDVDGLNKLSLANICVNNQTFVPATAKGVITLLKKYGIELSGKNALVIGRSRIVGKPVAYMLTNENCTVTLAHSKTKNLIKLVKEADILVVAVGKPKFVEGAWIKKGAIVIDTGYNEGNIGDVDFDSAKKKASYITPVPGGVGPMTIISLLEQCVISAERMIKE